MFSDCLPSRSSLGKRRGFLLWLVFSSDVELCTALYTVLGWVGSNVRAFARAYLRVAARRKPKENCHLGPAILACTWNPRARSVLVCFVLVLPRKPFRVMFTGSMIGRLRKRSNRLHQVAKNHQFGVGQKNGCPVLYPFWIAKCHIPPKRHVSRLRLSGQV